MKEETFGPIIPIQKFETMEKSIELANDYDHGLLASVWTKNILEGEDVAKKIYSGSVLIDDCISYFGTPKLLLGELNLVVLEKFIQKVGLWKWFMKNITAAILSFGKKVVVV